MAILSWAFSLSFLGYARAAPAHLLSAATQVLPLWQGAMLDPLREERWKPETPIMPRSCSRCLLCVCRMNVREYSVWTVYVHHNLCVNLTGHRVPRYLVKHYLEYVCEGVLG